MKIPVKIKTEMVRTVHYSVQKIITISFPQGILISAGSILVLNPSNLQSAEIKKNEPKTVTLPYVN